VAFFGRLLYTFNDHCDLESTIPYLFVVHYPTNWSATNVSNEIAFRIKSVFPELIANNIGLVVLEKRYELEIQKIVPTEDNGNKGPCSTSKAGYQCARITVNITFGHLHGADEGIIEFVLLQNAERVKDSLSLGDLDVYYSGDEPLETRLILTLFGVPNMRMGLKEIEFFQKTTKRYLKTNLESGDVEILAVEVEFQNLVGVGAIRRLDVETSSIDITTVVTGKHRPPSPGLDFDVLIESSVNSADSAFKEELIQSTTENGIDYFSSVEEIKAVAAGTLAPLQSPLVYGDFDVSEKGLGLVANIGIVVGAAICTFVLVFGGFLYRKRRQEKKRFKLHMEVDSDDEEDPLFTYIFKSNHVTKAENKVPPNHAFNKKDEDGNGFTPSSNYTTNTSLSDESPVYRNSGRDLLAYMNSKKHTQSTKRSNSRSGLGRKYEEMAPQSSAPSSQYETIKNGDNMGNTSLGRRSTSSSGRSQPEYDRFKDAKGRYPPSRENTRGSPFVNIDINDGLQGLDHQNESTQNEIFNDGDSSMMSSSTSSTL